MVFTSGPVQGCLLRGGKIPCYTAAPALKKFVEGGGGGVRHNLFL